MPRSFVQTAVDEEVNRDQPSDTSESAVNEVHLRLDVPLEMAKARLGHAVRKAIGGSPLKAYGHKGLVSAVCEGSKVPEYLARIYLDPTARRRFAFALLENDNEVELETTARYKGVA